MATVQKELKVKVSTGEYGATDFYGNDRISFSFCTPVKKGVTQQCVSWKTCRDYMQDSLRCAVLNENIESDSNGYYPGKNPPIDFKKIRMLVSSEAKSLATEKDWWYYFKKGIYFGKRIINFYEKTYGFKTQTRITEVQCHNRNKCWMLIGPDEWVNNPHLLSLFTLLLRVGTAIGKSELNGEKMHVDIGQKFNTNEEVLKVYKTITSTNHILDRFIIDNCKDKLHVLMGHRNDIFKDITPEELFPKAAGYYFHSTGGINSLCSFNSSNETVNKRFRNLVIPNKKDKIKK